MINVYGGIFMYKILLCCASGLTTSMLVNAMKKDAKEKNIDVMIWAVAESAIDLSWADADCILVAPQNAGDLEKVKGIVNSSIPVASIDGVNFSKIDGQAVLEQAIEMINK